ncbi:MAG: SDR family NAD(P)-dependent oxidoreductase [Flavobacteriaceae bacterium]
MSSPIGIAGMGWLGVPLAQHLRLLGYPIKGSVTSLEKATQLQQSGFEVYSVTVSEEGMKGSVHAFLNHLETLIVMIPPGLRNNTGSDYVLKMTHFLKEIEASPVQKCVFISSTSVYGDGQGTVTEAAIPKPNHEAGRQLFQVEQLFFNARFRCSIVRFGGLIGGTRQPVRYLAGREALSGGEAPVNLIHRDDCIGILSAIVQQNAFGHIFNAVHPSHPLKKDYYHQKALEMNLSPPSFSKEQETSHKKVNSINVPSLLNYPFQRDL